MRSMVLIGLVSLLFLVSAAFSAEAGRGEREKDDRDDDRDEEREDEEKEAEEARKERQERLKELEERRKEEREREKDDDEREEKRKERAKKPLIRLRLGEIEPRVEPPAAKPVVEVPRLPVEPPRPAPQPPLPVIVQTFTPPPPPPADAVVVDDGQNAPEAEVTVEPGEGEATGSMPLGLIGLAVAGAVVVGFLASRNDPPSQE